MSLETTVLIGVLTFLAIGVGADFCWNTIIKLSLLNIKDRSLTENLANLSQKTTIFVLAIFLLVLIGTIVLNLIPHSRLEAYLLKIGLLVLIFVVGLIFVELIPIIQVSQSLMTILNLTIWIRLLAEIIVYWSLLHYALNPKI